MSRANRRDARMTGPAGRAAAALCLAPCLVLAPAPVLGLDRAPLPSETPMEPCPSQGAGFARIPGTATCIRVSGRAAAGIDAGSGRKAAPVRGRLSIDARSPTDLGPMRSFLRIEAGAH